MFTDLLPELDNADPGQDQTLCVGRLIKTDETEDSFKWAGVASDEGEDTDGDRILRKMVDLTYAQQRGYVNWNHSKQPADQIGFITHAEILNKTNKNQAEDALGADLPESATVFTRGELYKHVPKAVEVQQILKSTPADAPGLGLSLDGVVARNKDSHGVVRAYVRGVAFTPFPAQPRTMTRLIKSLAGYEMMTDEGIDPANLSESIAKEVARSLMENTPLGELAKMTGTSQPLDFDKATLFILKKRPHLTYSTAARVVQFAIDRANQ